MRTAWQYKKYNFFLINISSTLAITHTQWVLPENEHFYSETYAKLSETEIFSPCQTFSPENAQSEQKRKLNEMPEM